MRKNFTILLIVISASILAQNKNIADYFVDMPSYLVPTFDSSFRLELSENYLMGTKDSLENINGNLVFVHDIDTINHYLDVQVTPNSRLEMKLLFNEKDTIIGIINTVCAPICSSYINFFDTQWEKLNIDYPKLTVKDWIKSENEIINDKNIYDYFPASFIEYSFQADKNIIIAKNHSLNFTSKTNKNIILPYIEKNDIVLIWDGKKFMLFKNESDQASND